MSEVRQMLLGNELVFSKEMDLFNSLRKKYLMLSVEARKEAEEAYDTRLSGYASYVSSCRSVMDGVFERYLQMGVADIIRYGIYDIDEVVLKQEFEAEIGSECGQKVDEFVGKIRQIDAEQVAADQERKEMIQEAGPIGSTYVATSGNIAEDLGSIVGAQVEKVAINALFKGGTALVTGGMRAVEKKGAEKEKNALFSKNSTKIDVLEGMEQDVYMLHRTIARLINERTGVEHYYYAKGEDILRFEPICRNIMRGNFKSEEYPDLERQQIHNVILMNPYELRMYCYIMQEKGTITEELKSVMDYLCVDKVSLANSYLETKYNLADYTTYEAMVEIEKVVIAELEQFEVDDCDFSYEVASKKETLYIERRTFRQYTYETIEERDAAEKQFYEFIGEGFEEQELDELLEKYEETFHVGLVEKNQEDIRALLMLYISAKVEEFQDTVSLEYYVSYAQTKKEEHRLEQSELLDVFEKKYKKLARKEKINAGVSAAKDKLSATAGNVMGRGKDLMQKMPFGKKTSEDSEVEAVPDSETEVVENLTTEGKTENIVTPATEKKKFGLSGVKEMRFGFGNKGKGETAVMEEKPATKTCPQCGAVVKEAGKFCNKCGYRF